MDAITIIIIVVLSLAVGFFTGRMMGEFRGESKESKQDIPDPHVLVIKRDTRSGKMMARLERKIYSGAGVLDARLKSELKKISTNLETWLGESAEIAQRENHENALRGEEFPARITHFEIETAEEETSKSSPGGFIARALSADIKSPDLKPNSVAAQVDEILQEKITGTPLAARGIRLMEFPGEGLVVMVGMEKYDSVDEVPDLSIRSAIKEAVSIWEDRMLNNE